MDSSRAPEARLAVVAGGEDAAQSSAGAGDGGAAKKLVRAGRGPQRGRTSESGLRRQPARGGTQVQCSQSAWVHEI